ncbi:MAG: beta-ketoacyl-ACP synthase 3 [Solirubrobacterales bacterium]|nr:beta-ketoacyl-ACP synthase 3 [Solirubrobacterales bacterium]
MNVIAERTDNAPVRVDIGAAVRQGVAVAAVGASLPDLAVGNPEIERRLGLSAGWIERRTGIRSRRLEGQADSLTGHSTAAAAEALDRAGISAAEVDLVLVATTTADDVLPNAAPMVAGALGAGRAGAFDIGAACTGFLSALGTGVGLIESGRAAVVVVIGADFMSRITDPADRGTASVFADGAGAVVLSAVDGASRVGPLLLGAEADTEGWIRVPREDPRILMDGHETYRVAVERMSAAALEAVGRSGLTLDEIDLFVFHQANSRILAAVARALEIDSDRVIECIASQGNTSAATLPLALASGVEEGRLGDGERVLLGAFGAGLTWGATVIEWGQGGV